MSDIVTVDLSQVPPNSPLGILLAPSALPMTSSNVVLVAGWEHVSNGRRATLGPVQRSGLVRLGDRLIRINDKDVCSWSFHEVMCALRHLMDTPTDARQRLKSLGFAPWHSPDWNRGTAELVLSEGHPPFPSSCVVISKRLYSFASFVHRWRIVPNDSSSSSSSSSSRTSLDPQQQQKGLHNPQSSTPATAKPYIEYEIQCYLHFRDSTSLRRKSNNPNYPSNNHHPNNVLHSWSVWKRYSQFQKLDAQLRTTFSWQMEIMEEKTGVTFPSQHLIEQYWYRWRNRGGLLTLLLGGNSGATTQKRIEPTSTGVASREKQPLQQGQHNDIIEEGSTGSVTSHCSYPTHFMEKRQNELAIYWANLMKIEDIFDFGDVNSHRFSKAMALFLEVTEILTSRQGGIAPAPETPIGKMSSAFPSIPVIPEEEEPLELPTHPWNVVSHSPEVPLLAIRDEDDVSLLSDGTGALREVESRYWKDDANAQVPFVSSSTVVTVRSTSSVSGERRIGRTPRRVKQGAKPAFQRQFLIS